MLFTIRRLNCFLVEGSKLVENPPELQIEGPKLVEQEQHPKLVEQNDGSILLEKPVKSKKKISKLVEKPPELRIEGPMLVEQEQRPKLVEQNEFYLLLGPPTASKKKISKLEETPPELQIEGPKLVGQNGSSILLEKPVKSKKKVPKLVEKPPELRIEGPKLVEQEQHPELLEEPATSEEEGDSFFKFVAPKLKSLSPEEGMRLHLRVLENWGTRKEMLRIMEENKLYVSAGLKAGQIALCFSKILEDVVDKYKRRVIQNRFSAMMPLREAFYFENKSIWLQFIAGDELYSELKCVFLYTIIAEMVADAKLTQMTIPELVRTVLSTFGVESHNILGKALVGLISMDEILQIKEEVCDNRIDTGNYNSFKDLHFNDTYTISWEWATDELIGTPQERYLVVDPKLPRVSSRRPFKPIDKEVLKMIKATKEGVRTAQNYLVESVLSDNKRIKLDPVESPVEVKSRKNENEQIIMFPLTANNDIAIDYVLPLPESIEAFKQAKPVSELLEMVRAEKLAAKLPETAQTNELPPKTKSRKSVAKVT